MGFDGLQQKSLRAEGEDGVLEEQEVTPDVSEDDEMVARTRERIAQGTHPPPPPPPPSLGKTSTPRNLGETLALLLGSPPLLVPLGSGVGGHERRLVGRLVGRGGGIFGSAVGTK